MKLAISQTHRELRRTRQDGLGPHAALAGAVAAAACFGAVLHPDAALPAAATLLYLAAAAVALLSMHRGDRGATDRVTYWDVAGALTLLGIAVASQVEPDQMVRLMHGAGRAG